jgi:hypothetical protein
VLWFSGLVSQCSSTSSPQKLGAKASPHERSQWSSEILAS